MPVFIWDLKSLFGKDVNNEKGYFNVKMSIRAFSSTDEDHSHEQNNKITKGDGGARCIFGHEEALLEWTVCGPVIADMFQYLPGIGEDQFHHESTYNFEKTFRNNNNKFFEDFLYNGNSFVQCEENLVNILSKTVVNKESSKYIREALLIGMVQIRIY